MYVKHCQTSKGGKKKGFGWLFTVLSLQGLNNSDTEQDSSMDTTQTFWMESWLNNHPPHVQNITKYYRYLQVTQQSYEEPYHYNGRSVVRSERFLTDLRSMQFSHRSSASQPWDFERKSATQASPAAKEKTQTVNSMGQRSL